MPPVSVLAGLLLTVSFAMSHSVVGMLMYESLNKTCIFGNHSIRIFFFFSSVW